MQHAYSWLMTPAKAQPTSPAPASARSLIDAVKRVRDGQNQIDAAYSARDKAIREALALGVSQRELARLVGAISASTILRATRKDDDQ